MSPSADYSADVVVVGGGISGMSAAAAMAANSAIASIAVFDRGKRLGGRMAARTLRTGPWAGHVVDIGASYFTVSDPDFAEVVARWVASGLARPWTDTFAIAGPEGIVGSTSSPLRWTAGAAGLRGLVEELTRQLPASVTVANPVTASGIEPREGGSWRVLLEDRSWVDAGRVALCMPTPQATGLLESTESRQSQLLTGAHPHADLIKAAQRYEYDPSLVLIAQWDRREWDSFHGCFVNGDEVLSFIADDGSRRGDKHPILVAYSTRTFAARHLVDPAAATAEMLAAVRRVLALPAPFAVEVKRWTYARPAKDSFDAPYLVNDEGTLGIAGDAFDPRSRVEAAWLSGRRLGTLLSAREASA